MLQINFTKVLPIIEAYFRERLSKNALVIKSKEPCKPVVPKNNHLQEVQDKEEEHQEGKVDEERYITNTMFVDDVSLFSNDSYYA